jgi:hypothetical protein
MDLYKLQAALKRLHEICWNVEIDEALQEAGYPKDTPQESALYRHVIVVRDNQAEFNEAFRDFIDSLGQFSDYVKGILIQVFTSPIPAGQLASATANLRDLVLTLANYEPVIELAVCLSHEQALRDLERYLDRVKGEAAGKDQPAETGREVGLGKWQRKIAWFKTHPHSYGLAGGGILLIVFLGLALLIPQWRLWCLGTAIIPLVLLILSLLGGRTHP